MSKTDISKAFISLIEEMITKEWSGLTSYMKQFDVDLNSMTLFVAGLVEPIKFKLICCERKQEDRIMIYNLIN